MKKLFKTLTLGFLFFPLLCLAQEPVVIHFDFTFEKSTWKELKRWSLTEDIERISLKILNNKQRIIWEKKLTNTDLTKDDYGYCLISDTIKNLKRSPKPYILKVNYLLTSGINDSCKLLFSYPDSVQNIALELFFDQSLAIRMADDKFDILPHDTYEIDSIPKPVLIIKYMGNKNGVYLGPTWFQNGLNRRPVYVLYNNSPNEIYRKNNDMFTCFFGNLYTMDSNLTWKKYKFGPVCGTFSCEDTIHTNDTFYIVEGYPIAREPRKLINGRYKYAVQYKDANGSIKEAITHFTIVYSKINWRPILSLPVPRGW